MKQLSIVKMTKSIFSSMKLIKKFGLIFGFFPFTFDKSHKNFRNVYALNCIYASFLISVLVLVMYLNFTVLSDWMQETSLMPSFIHRVTQSIPTVVNISQTFGIFVHIQSFSSLNKIFREIDSKVNCP
ncbi:hypothetical protein ACKWTF_016288 [Chironomus riparius]